jgi:hypothetical protein
MAVQFAAIWNEGSTVFENIGYLQHELRQGLRSFHAVRKKKLINEEIEELHEVAYSYDCGELTVDEVDELLKERIRMLNRDLKKALPKKKKAKEQPLGEIVYFPFARTAEGRAIEEKQKKKQQAVKSAQELILTSSVHIPGYHVPPHKPQLKLITNDKFTPLQSA